MGYEACGDQIHFPFELKLSPNPISEMQPCSSNSYQDREYDDDDDGKDDDDDEEEEASDDVDSMMNSLKLITFHRRAQPGCRN